ncbi:aldehyde dehydrogenase family protein, partial [Petrachloros mirabilis]
MTFESINPTTGKPIQTYTGMNPKEASAVVDACHKAFLEWRKVSFPERAQLIKRAAQILREHAMEYATLMTREMGKPISGALSEVEKCAWVCDYYAQNAQEFLKREIVETDAAKSFVTFQPIGVVLAIMPWNFPFWQVFRFAAPALMAGNGGVLKHASNVPGCALAIEDVFVKAGLPKDIFRAVLVSSKEVDAVISHPYVRAVTLTGSTPAGKAVARKAGELLKKTVLELGGSDPYVILEDADLDSAVAACVTGRLINSGQSCIAAKRFIVVEAVLERFTKKFVEGMKSQKVGDPMEKDTVVGPLA